MRLTPRGRAVRDTLALLTLATVLWSWVIICAYYGTR